VTTEALQTINRRINRTIRRASDTDAFGREDVWVLPTGPRPTGDCEDYVLAKRRALIEAGITPAALSIAIVRTRRGETHAVLLVATAEGEQVLDNLSPWVLRWDQAPYEWIQRQAPGRALSWVTVTA
jgi:predicted transglutaminase-like cysteine proteinase